MKGEDRREEVLVHAAALFAERGFHQTSISHIVERGGIARGTFYLYFKDKRTVFEELLDRLMTALRARIVRIDPGVGEAEALRLMRANIRGVLEVCLEHRALTKILLSEAVGLDPEFDQKLLAFWDEVVGLLERSLTLGRGMGLVRAVDIPTVATCVLGSLKELLYQNIMRGHSGSVEIWVEELLALWMHGVLTLPT